MKILGVIVNKDFFFKCSTLLGLWAPENLSSKSSQRLYQVYAITVFLTAHLLNIVLQFFSIINFVEYQKLPEMFYIFNNSILSCVKFVLMYRKREKLIELENILRSEDFLFQNDQERRIRDRYHNFLRYGIQFNIFCQN